MVQILATDTGEVLKAFEGHSEKVQDVAWSIDGRLASCSDDGTVRLWDPGTFKSDLLIERETDRPHFRWSCIKFSPDGSQLAASTFQTVDAPVVIWNMNNLDQGKRLPVAGGMEAFNWSHDGTRLAGVVFPGNAVEVWEPESGKLVGRLTNHFAQIRSTSWSPDDRRLASRTLDGRVYLCDAEQEELRPIFVGHRNGVRQLAWSPDGHCFATGEFGGTVRIWDVRSEQELGVFDGHESSAIRFLDWHPQQDRLVSCDDSGDALVWSWDGTQSRQIRRLEPHSSDFQIKDICWSPDGSQIAIAERKGWRQGAGLIRIIDADTFDTLDEFGGDGTDSISWEQNSGGNSLLAVADRNQVTVWDPAKRTSDHLLPKSLKLAQLVSLSPQVDRVAVAGESNLETFGNDAFTASLWIIDLQTMQERRLRGHYGTVTSIHWSADGTRLLTSAEDGICILWDAVTGQQLVSFNAPDRLAVFTAQFSPDELQIAFAGRFPGVRLLDATPSYEEQLSAKLLPGLADRIRSAPTSEDLVLRGRIKANQGNSDEASQDFERAAELTASGKPRDLWFETAWWLAGPYPESLAERQPPEQHFDPHQPIPAAGALGDPITWDAMGISEKLDLGAYLAGAEHVSAYAMKRIYSAERETIGLLLGADDQLRVWCNGTLKHAREEARTAVSDDEAVEITLEAGWNDLLIKVTNRTGAHGLFARLSRNPRKLAEVFNRNQQWEQALVWWERAAATQSDDLDLFVAHGRAALRSGRRELAEDLFEKALQAGNRIWVRRKIAATYLEDALAQSDGAAESLNRSQQHYERLKSEGDHDQDVGGVANVLLARSALKTDSTWTVLEPVGMESSGGATLTQLEDGSILASGINPDSDSYELVMETSLTTIAGVRLEVMTDETLPNRGPGRSASPNGQNGAFMMSSWDWEDETSRAAIRFDQVASNYPGVSPRVAITVNRWSIAGGEGESHEAVYRVATPIRRNSGLRFRIKMQFNQGPYWADQNLGRFRISVTDDATTFSREQRHFIAAKISDPRLKLAEAYDLNDKPDLAMKTMDSVLENWNRRILAGTASPAIFQSRGELRARRGRIEEAIADFVSAAKNGSAGVVDRVLRLGQDSPGTVDSRIALLNAALIHDPDHIEGLWEKAKLDYGLKRLDEAAQTLRRIVELAPNDPRAPHQLGALLIKTGDLKGYRQFRKSMIDRAQTINKAHAAASTAEICLLLPLEDLDKDQHEALEKLSEFGDSGLGGQGLQWDQVRKGMLAFRRGDFHESHRWSKRSLSAFNDAPAIAVANCFGAMAQQKLGHEAEARERLQEANRVITEDFPLLPEWVHANWWNNLVIAEIAYDEAKRLINPKD